MRSLPFLVCGLALVLSPVTRAHEPYICPSGEPGVIVAYFEITPAELSTFKVRNSGRLTGHPCTLPDGVQGTCGIVDDWDFTHMAMHSYCTEIVRSTPPPGSMGLTSAQTENFDHSEAMPVAAGPADYLNHQHERSYEFSDGNVYGACVVCPDVKSDKGEEDF